jgi:hypothetical protein
MGIVVALSSFLNPSPDWSHGLLSSGAPLGHMVRMGLVDLLPRGVAPAITLHAFGVLLPT